MTEDSSDMTITYKAIRDRAQQDAMDRMPDLPKVNTIEAWEYFQADVENLDAYDIAHESCEWDWVIYYHRAMELCQAVPSDVLHDAERGFEDIGGFEHMASLPFGLYELAFQFAAIIVTREVAEAVEQVKEELIDLAETQLGNMGP